MCKRPIDAWQHRFKVNENGNSIIVFQPQNSKDWKHILVNCSRCIDCRMDSSRKWAIRCLNELEYWDDACFITLTYKDEFLPRRVNCDTGEIAPALYRKHIVDFVKRLRTHLNRKHGINEIKVYYCGEYGSKTGRPHFHLLCFGYRPKDLQFYKCDKLGFRLYNSNELSSLWYSKVPNYDKKVRRKYNRENMGFVVIGDVSFESCSYVARYIIKKQKADSERYEVQTQELLGCSRGIGKKWFYDNYKTMYANGFINYVHNGQIKKCGIPKYYDSLLKDLDLNLYREIKAERQRYISDCVDFSDLESQEKCIEYKNNKILKRSLDYEENL